MRCLRNSRNFALALLRSPVKERGLAEGRKCASTEQKGVARANLKVFTWQTGKASDVTCSQSVSHGWSAIFRSPFLPRRQSLIKKVKWRREGKRGSWSSVRPLASASSVRYINQLMAATPAALFLLLLLPLLSLPFLHYWRLPSTRYFHRIWSSQISKLDICLVNRGN